MGVFKYISLFRLGKYGECGDGGSCVQQLTAGGRAGGIGASTLSSLFLERDPQNLWNSPDGTALCEGWLTQTSCDVSSFSKGVFCVAVAFCAAVFKWPACSNNGHLFALNVNNNAGWILVGYECKM